MANKIGQEVYVHGYIDEERKDVCIIRNEGGYFGTVMSEIRTDGEMVSRKDIEAALEELREERNKCYKDDYGHGMGWGFQSSIEILERRLFGGYRP